MTKKLRYLLLGDSSLAYQNNKPAPLLAKKIRKVRLAVALGDLLEDVKITGGCILKKACPSQ